METPGTDEPSPSAASGATSSPAATPPTSSSAAPLIPPTPPVPPVPPTSGSKGSAQPGPDGPQDLGRSVHSAVDDVESIFEGGLDGEWPARAADAIVNVVGVVRDNTTGRITTLARGLVFGLFAAIIGTAFLVVVIIASIRLLDQVLPSGVWVAYLVLGVIVLVAGALVFRKRNQPRPTAGNTGRS